MESSFNIAGSMNRRTFASSLAAFGMGTVAFGVAGCAAPETAKAKFSAWDEVSLGKTGIRTTRLGFGTGVNAHNRSSGILRRNGRDGAVKLLRAAYERGIRFFDTADSYGTHDAVREALAPFPRSSYTICSKYWFQRGGIPGQTTPTRSIPFYSPLEFVPATGEWKFHTNSFNANYVRDVLSDAALQEVE